MVDKFNEFRDAYLEYVNEYNNYKLAQRFTQMVEGVNVPPGESTYIENLSQMQMSSGLLAKKLIPQLHDTFINEKEKLAYLSSIKTFIINELDGWSFREPEQKIYKWQRFDKSGRIYREWMPDYLYDILNAVKQVERGAARHFFKSSKASAKKNTSLEYYLTDEGNKLLPKLIVAYKNSKPADIAYMWHAMNDLTTLISENVSNHSELHRLLKNMFGYIGALQSFASHMRSLKNGRSPYQDDQIADHISKIKSLK